ncbi:uncharacterized protein EI90DRAFT_3157531 [Cantharellus anzutake]|uniref:uncharacterized protein n=1 Tax=Cantharellus anzutake TaxID=1750568 RepID=UPI00190309C5|nr:uncharacterized protein EI90DRAFT_3157531 [Cantharellus anzutake]KAF8324223.1 hypothetical protein EI90DRAFT_3157531 [Cantharellus anzutake]
MAENSLLPSGGGCLNVPPEPINSMKRNRPARKCVRKIQPAEEDSYPGSDSDYDDSKPGRKTPAARMARRHKLAAAARIRKGRLAKYLHRMPVEIMAEIYSYVSPRDLLSLARSGKVFARYLLGLAGTWVWKLAREAVPDLPPLSYPHDLTEQKYALLAFGVHCQKCGTVSTNSTDWDLRRRWCMKCRNSIDQDPDWCDVLGETWPFPFPLDRTAIVYFSLVICEGGKYHKQICKRSEFEDLKREFQSFSEKQDKEGLGKFIKKRQELRQSVSAHAVLCRQWVDSYRSSRRAELRSVQQTRIAAVREKLKDEGFMPQLVDEANLSRIRTIRVSKLLSAQHWSSIKGNAIEVMKEFVRNKHCRLTESLKKIVQRKYAEWYCSRDPMGAIWPSPSHFDRNKTIEALTRDYVDQRFTEIIKRRESFVDMPIDVITEKFEAIAHHYSREIREKLYEMVPEELRLATPEETFALARTVFKSPYAHSSRHFHYVVYILGTQIGDPLPVSFDATSSQIISDIIRSGGWDPDTMTVPQLDATEIRVECMTCANEKGFGPKYTWQGVYQHIPAHVKEDQEPQHTKWRILREHERQRYIREAEERAILQMRIRIIGPKWRCCLCPVIWQWAEVHADFPTEDEVKEHILTEHPMARPDVQVCYMEDISVSPTIRASAEWNPHACG